MLSRETTNTNSIVFGLTRSGLEPTIYRTLGEHVNHYTTDVVQNHGKNKNYRSFYMFSTKTNRYLFMEFQFFFHNSTSVICHNTPSGKIRIQLTLNNMHNLLFLNMFHMYRFQHTHISHDQFSTLLL